MAAPFVLRNQRSVPLAQSLGKRNAATGRTSKSNRAWRACDARRDWDATPKDVSGAARPIGQVANLDVLRGTGGLRCIHAVAPMALQRHACDHLARRRILSGVCAVAAKPLASEGDGGHR